MGTLPDSESALEGQLEKIHAALEKIARPVSREEAALLMTLFGPDECYGLAWTLLHLIETAPGDLPFECIPAALRENEWINRLRVAEARAKEQD